MVTVVYKFKHGSIKMMMELYGNNTDKRYFEWCISATASKVIMLLSEYQPKRHKCFFITFEKESTK